MILALILTGCSGCTSLESRILNTPFAQSGYIPTSSNIPEGRLRIFVAHVEHIMGVTVEFNEAMEGSNAAGMASLQSRIIRIDARLPPAAKLEVIAHEAGHLLGPPNLSRSEGEVFAEAVSIETCRRLGLNTTRAVVGYLAQHKQALHVLRAYRHEIQWAATVLAGR